MAGIARKPQGRLVSGLEFYLEWATPFPVVRPFMIRIRPFIVRWPQTNIPTIAFAMPIGIADFLLISGAISLAEKVFSGGRSSDEEEG